MFLRPRPHAQSNEPGDLTSDDSTSRGNVCSILTVLLLICNGCFSFWIVDVDRNFLDIVL